MAENSVIISSEEEAKLLKPIDEYVEEIQKKIDALRADGFDKVSDLKKQIAIAKENKNLSATQRDKIIENSMNFYFNDTIDGHTKEINDLISRGMWAE